MAITGTDTLGTYTDTGVNSTPTQRANVEVEVHASTETDSGSKNTVAQTTNSHGPHRDPKSPR